jgi:hypothetical protein
MRLGSSSLFGGFKSGGWCIVSIPQTKQTRGTLGAIMITKYHIDMKKGLLFVLIVLFSCRGNDNVRKVDDFWNWFRKNKTEFQYKSFEEYNLSDSIFQKTKFIDPDISITLFKDSVGRTYKMLISAEGQEKCFESVQLIKSRAPHFDDFQVIAFMPRNKSTIIEIEYTNGKISSEDVFFSYEKVANSKLIDVNIYAKNFKDTNTFKAITSELIMYIVGEWDAVKSINSINYYCINDTINNKVYKITKLAKIIDENK